MSLLSKILSTLQCGCEEAPCFREDATVVETRPNIFKKKVFDKKNLKVNFKSDSEVDRQDDLKEQAEREKIIDKQIQDLQIKSEAKFSCSKFLCFDGNTTIDEEKTQNLSLELDDGERFICGLERPTYATEMTVQSNTFSTVQIPDVAVKSPIAKQNKTEAQKLKKKNLLKHENFEIDENSESTKNEDSKQKNELNNFSSNVEKLQDNKNDLQNKDFLSSKSESEY